MNNRHHFLFSVAVAAGLALCAISSQAQDVNITGNLTYLQGTGGVYDYTLTLSNSGPEAVESLWLGWIVGNFDIAAPTAAGNSLGWSSTVDGNSIQYGGSAGTALASGASATFTFDSTSNPAEFQAGTAGPSVAYGVEATQFAIENTTLHSREFAPAVVSNSPPIITTQPESQTVLTNTTVTFSVTASNATSYQWQSNLADLAGATNDSLILSNVVTADSATYQVVVSNAFGQQTSSSAVLTVQILTSAIKQKLAVTINPAKSGSVSPNMNGKSLLVTHSYTVTAVAAKGHAFASWTGIAESDDPSLTFVMPDVSNATLTANFIPSPFASNGVAGTYAGLFLDETNLSNETAGYFSATVAGNGVIAGQVKIAGVSTTFSSTLHSDGSATMELKRHNLSSLVLTLQVDLTGLETLGGTVGDASNTFNAQLTAYRAGFSASHAAANYDGYYTWEMPGAAGNTPAGYSYGTATVAAAGTVRLSIFLSDGTTSTASGSLSTNGQMPLYVSLYGGKGSLLSWLSFPNSSKSLSTNGSYWFKDPSSSDPSGPPYTYLSPESVAKNSYANGFTLTNLTLLMGAYTAEAKGTNALNATSVAVQLSAGGWTNSISNVIALNTSGLGGSGTNTAVNMSDKTGVFSGSFRHPASGRKVTFKGVVLDASRAGYGFFVSGGLGGAVLIDAQ